MGESEVDTVLASKRDDDLESSLVLAVPLSVAMVGTVLVGEGIEDMVELLGTGRGPVRDVSLGKKAVNSPRRGLCLPVPVPVPIVSASPLACFVPAPPLLSRGAGGLGRSQVRNSSKQRLVSTPCSFFFFFFLVEEYASRLALPSLLSLPLFFFLALAGDAARILSPSHSGNPGRRGWWG